MMRIGILMVTGYTYTLLVDGGYLVDAICGRCWPDWVVELSRVQGW